jgi:hypothetical protein
MKQTDGVAMLRGLYLELLKKSLGNFIYDDDLDLMTERVTHDPATGKVVPVAPRAADPAKKFIGGIWPSRAHTMIGKPRLDNLQACVERILADDIPGDLIETGVWRGGACILMRGVLKAYGVSDRRVWVADSFEGLPPADLARYPKEATAEFHRHAVLAVSLDEVRGNFERYGLLDEQVRFLKGWFRDTLPAAPIERLAILRLDGDLYESTMDGLVNLYPKLSPGGFVIVDDYNMVPACNAAVHDFGREQQIYADLVELPGAGAYWRKPPG